MTAHRRIGTARRTPGTADLPTRPEIVAAVAGILSAATRRWAWQGPADAVARWLAESGPHDLDLWYDPAPGADPVALIRRALPCARVAVADDPGRLRHTSLAIETPDGPAVVDLTRGDLRVGPILLIPAEEIETASGTAPGLADATAHGTGPRSSDATAHGTGPRLAGVGAIADLLARPVLRGRLPTPARLAEARAAWAGLDPVARRRLYLGWERELGRTLAGALIRIAEGGSPDPGLPRRARRRLLVRSLAPDAAAATWAQRRAVWPAGRAAGPLGLRTRGVVVALVGTDGSGKSTVAGELRDRLHRYGLPTSTTYFGMARGNLPGVALARRLLRIGAEAGAPATDGAPAGAVPDRTADAATTAGLDRPALRRLAAWYYAGEYVWRFLRRVLPPLARRHVVIADRWVHDLRESPWPGSPAARFAESLVPAPDLLVLPDAPIETIHRRKPERPLAEQRAQQERFRRLLAQRPARCAEVVVDTSGRAADPLAALVAAVVEAAHHPARRR